MAANVKGDDLTDLEIRRLCAQAIGFPAVYIATAYDPFHNDALAMELLKKFKLEPRFNEERRAWHVTRSYASDPYSWNADLNRAICECVAKMQQGEKP